MYIRPELRVPIVTGVAAAVSGLGIGYILGKSKGHIEVHVEDQIIEVETVVECEVCKQRSTDQADMVNVIETAGYLAIDETSYPDLNLVPSTMAEVDADSRAILDEHPSVVDTAAKLVNEEYDEEFDEGKEELEEERSIDTPYTISLKEWDRDERGFQQIECRWFTGDKILVDENDVPIPRPEHVVGRLEFGRASGDGNVVYIRNESLDAEYRVERVDAHYITEVMGIEAEEEAAAEDIKHSQRIPKFRLRD